MYQRMLNKSEVPTIAEMTMYCGQAGRLFSQLNEWLTASFVTDQQVVFPYGNSYGWGISHRKKTKLMCNVFAEDGAFTVMLRLTNKQWSAVYDKAQSYMREYIDNKYPCSGGGWIHYRVACEEQLDDIMTALTLRCS